MISVIELVRFFSYVEAFVKKEDLLECMSLVGL